MLFTCVAVITMFTLGVWQLQRLAWKESLIERLSYAQSQPPVELISLPTAALPAHEFTRVRFSGRPTGSAIHVAARYFHGQLGYHILLPMQIYRPEQAESQQFEHILVNVGWIPVLQKNVDWRGPPEEFNVWKDVNGMVRIAGRKGRFTPDNQPEKNLWFWYDIPAMEKSTGLKLAPVVIDRIDPQANKAFKDVNFPVGFSGEITLRNDHLGYAVTWFGVGLACLGVFIAYHLKRREP